MSLRMFICAYALNTIFYACFLIQNYRYTSYLLDIGFTTDSLISTYVTGHCLYRMPKPHHLIMYTCDCLSTPLGFILRTRWVVFWQPWTFMFISRSLHRGGPVVADQSAQWKRGLAVICVEPLFFYPPWLAHDSHLAACGYFQPFYIANHALCVSWWSNIFRILYDTLW